MSVSSVARPREVEVSALFALLLVVSVLPYTAMVPKVAGYAVSLLSLAAFAWASMALLDRLEVRRYVVLSLGAIWLIFAGHVVVGVATDTATAAQAMRVPVFILSTFVGVLIVPNAVPRSYFSYVLSRLAAILVVVGLPTAVVGSYGLFGIQLHPWHETIQLPRTDITLGMVRSILRNPNAFGFVCMAGAFSAAAELWRRGTRTSAVLLATSLLGVTLSASRAAALGTAFGIGVLVAAVTFDGRRYVAVVSVGWLALAVLVAMLLNLIPAVGPVGSIELTGRRVLWAGAAEAVARRPLVGYGPGDTGALIAPFVEGRYSGFNPHNSYVRLFVTTGVVGGVSYLLFVSMSLLQTLRGGPEYAPLLALTSALAITQLFSAYSLFGIAVMSVVAAIAFGYAAVGPGSAWPQDSAPDVRRVPG